MHSEIQLDRSIAYVIDDDAGLRDGIGTLLRSVDIAVETFGSAKDFLRSKRPDVPGCLILDVRLPGMSGPDLQDRLIELGSTLPIIFLTGYSDIPTTVRTIKAGGQDFLIKPVLSDQLLQSVERAIAHHNAVLNLKHTRDAVLSHIATLTPRERQVFDLVIQGKTNKEIARAIGGSERTIKAHRHRVMEKMQVQSLAELVSFAARVGVVAFDNQQTP